MKPETILRRGLLLICCTFYYNYPNKHWLVDININRNLRQSQFSYLSLLEADARTPIIFINFYCAPFLFCVMYTSNCVLTWAPWILICGSRWAIKQWRPSYRKRTYSYRPTPSDIQTSSHVTGNSGSTLYLPEGLVDLGPSHLPYLNHTTSVNTVYIRQCPIFVTALQVQYSPYNPPKMSFEFEFSRVQQLWKWYSLARI